MIMKKKLAIISTFDDLCGIAGYTRHLIKQLDEFYEITVFDLDQYMFRSNNKRIKRLAEKEVRRICFELKNYDCVNIQLEHGTLGISTEDILNRFKKFVYSSPKICITFHTILTESTRDNVLKTLIKGRLKQSIQVYKSNRKVNDLEFGINKILKNAQIYKPTSIVTHTRRDARNFRLVNNFKNVYDHPLAFLSKEEAKYVRENTSLEKDFPSLAIKLKEGDVLLGVFGFMGKYKGIETAIKALKLLPKNYHLAIFGGLHPNAITKNTEIDGYVKSLLDMIQPNRTVISGDNDFASNIRTNLNVDEFEKLLLEKAPENLSDRIHFMGSLSDEEFPKAMNVCDTVILPYLEVGQSASGPMSIAVDVGANILASRTKAFMQFARYNPNRFKMFEIGNYVQLSQMIEAYSLNKKDSAFEKAKFNVESNIEIYKKALFLEEDDNGLFEIQKRIMNFENNIRNKYEFSKENVEKILGEKIKDFVKQTIIKKDKEN